MSSDSEGWNSPKRKRDVEVRQTKEDKRHEAKKEEDRLTWMYKKPSELIDREEYLLGKAIDKSFEAMNGTGDFGGKTDLSNVPPRILSRSDIKEQVDIDKKIHEDPLYAIKQKEMEARKKLLNNPVRLKEIKKLIEERNRRAAKKEKKKKKKKSKDDDLDQVLLKKLKKLSKKEKKKTFKKIDDSESESDSKSPSESESESSEEDVKKHKKKKKSSDKKSKKKSKSSDDTNSDSDSTEDDDSDKDDFKKKSSKESRKPMSYRKRKSESSEEEADQVKEPEEHQFRNREPARDFDRRRRDFRNNEPYQNQRFNRNSYYQPRYDNRFRNNFRGRGRFNDFRRQDYRPDFRRQDFRRNRSRSRSRERRNDEVDERRDRGRNDYQDFRGNRRQRSRSRSNDNKRNNSEFAERNRNSDFRSEKRDRDRSRSKDRKKDEGERSRKEKSLPKNTQKESSSDSSDDERPKSKKAYGLMMPDGSKPKKDVNYEAVPRYEKKEPEKPKYVRQESKPVTEEEKEKLLREMMENAKWRKEDREKNLHKHRKAQKRDEKIEDYDENFLRKQMSIAVGHGSMADRIKSNLNNIQRSSRAMDTSFMKK